jgi:rhamnosyltransferase
MRSASVVVRTLNSGATLERCLQSLATQTVRPEIIVVDSGSTDETLQIAARYANRIEHITPERFTYGRALNLGASVATGDVCFALSSHCAAPSLEWVEIALGHYERPEVAGTNGHVTQPDGQPLTKPIDVTVSTSLPNPRWCFSNHASSWRTTVWQDFPFDEDLGASEDADWSDRVVASGHTIVFDPALLVPGDHRRNGGVRQYFWRTRRDLLTIAGVRPITPPTLLATVQKWALEIPQGTKWYRQLLSPWRTAELLGHWSAGREIRRTDPYVAARRPHKRIAP